MMWFFAILIVLALGGVAVVAAGRGAADSGRRTTTRPTRWSRPTGPVTADDLRRIRFPLAFRGYRMAEVDALLERLAGSWSGDRSDDRRAAVKATLPTRPSDRRLVATTRRLGHTERL